MLSQLNVIEIQNFISVDSQLVRFTLRHFQLSHDGTVFIVGGLSHPPWVRSKLKALASLLGRLGIKAAEALPGIIGGIISWILNRAKDIVGWVSQNLWALVVGIGGLIYTYMVTRK